MTGPSRLYRALPGPRPLFTVTTPGHTWGDTGIESIVIRHGKDDPAGGLHPATAEVRVAGAVGVINDRDVTIRVHPDVGVALGTSGADVRFTGRVSTQSVTERPRLGRPARMTSVLSCSSWSAVYLASGLTSWLSFLQPMNEALVALFDKLRPRVGKSIPFLFRGDWSDLTYQTENEGTLSEHLGAQYAEPGYLIRQRRTGELEGMTLAYRAAAGTYAAENAWPLMQSHVSGETEHAQDVDVSNIGIRITWREWNAATGQADTYTRDWAWPGSSDGVDSSSIVEWRTYDWSHIAFKTEQYRWGINALSSQAFRTAFTTPAVKIDLLHLINSPREYDRTMAAQLLNLHAGDPVVLGGDWESWWSGIYYAEQITERITPDEWSLELSLHTIQEVTGHYGAGTVPAIPPRTWSMARQPWSSADTMEWN